VVRKQFGNRKEKKKKNPGGGPPFFFGGRGPDLATEARRPAEGWNILPGSCNAANVTIEQLGPGLAIAMRRSNCKRIRATVGGGKEALPTLSKAGVSGASALKSLSPGSSGTPRPATTTSSVLPERHDQPRIFERGLELPRQISVDSVGQAGKIHVNADKARAMTSLLLKDMDDQNLKRLRRHVAANYRIRLTAARPKLRTGSERSLSSGGFKGLLRFAVPELMLTTRGRWPSVQSAEDYASSAPKCWCEVFGTY